jgi:hypothetical protein
VDPYPLVVQPLDWALGIKGIKNWHYDLFEERFEEATNAGPDDEE